MAFTKEQNKSTENVPEETQMLGLLDKDFKTAVLKMLKELNEDIKTEKWCTTKMRISMKRNYKKNQEGILELKV